MSDAKPRWTRLAVLGFLSAISALVLFLIAIAAFRLDAEDAGFFGVVAALLAVVAFLVWRFGTWSKVVGAVIAFLGSFGLFWMVFGLLRPQNFFDFLPSILFTPGLLLALVSCIAAIVSKRRGHVVTAAEGGERRGIRIAVAVAAAAALLSGVLTITNRSTADGTQAAATLSQKSFKYAPKAISVTGGSKVFVRDDDPFFHTFTIDALGIDVPFTAGSSKLVAIPARPGTYIFYCKPHTEHPKAPSESDMAGTITIT
jgi:plastocyanin